MVTVHAYVPSNGICRGFAFKYGKFLLLPSHVFLTALLVPKVPTCEQKIHISSNLIQNTLTLESDSGSFCI